MENPPHWSLREVRPGYFQAACRIDGQRIAVTLGRVADPAAAIARLGDVPDGVLRLIDPTVLSKWLQGKTTRPWSEDGAVVKEEALASVPLADRRATTVADVVPLYIALLRANGRGPTADRQERQWDAAMKRALGHYQVTSLDPPAWTRYLDSRPVSVRTKQLETTLMRSVLSFAQERGMLKAAPALKAPRPTGAAKALVKIEGNYLEEDELDKLLATLKHALHRTWVRVQTDAVLRVNECLGLTWGDVDLERRALKVRGTKTATSVRTTPLTKKATAALTAWLAAWAAEMKREPTGEDPLWIWRGGRIHGAPMAIVRASKAAGKRITVRGLRHTGATRIGRKSGVSPADLQAIGGWASPLIPLQIYSHVNDQRKREVLAKLDEE